MALQYPGISYLKGYDGKISDILDQWLTGVEAGRNERDEGNAGDLIAKLFSAQSGGGQQLAGSPLNASGGNPIDSLVGGSHQAVANAEDPMLAAYFANTRRAESGGNDSAKNPNSSATGRYQFLDATWADLAQRHPELGLTPEGRNDPAQQEAAMKAFTMDNARQLTRAGVDVNPGTLYAAHFLGAGGASKVLRAPPDTPVASLVGPEVIQANPHLANMTVADFQQWAASKGGGANGGYTAPMVDSQAATAPASIDPELMSQLFANRTTRPFVIEMMKARAKTEGGGGDLGLSPQYGVDAEGNPVLIQLGKDGRGVKTVLPPGVTLSKEPIKLDAGTHFVLLDPITRQPVGQVEKNNEQAAYETGFGSAAGKAAAERIEALPGVLSKADDMMTTIDGILNDPALDVSTGWLSWMQLIPGTDQYRFGQRALQLQGQAFLQAFESLKGGGQITEVEGAKATQAIGRLSTAQKPEDYRDALNELRSIVNAAKERAQARGGGNTAPSPVQVTDDASYDALPSGTVFIAPDGSTRRKP